MAKKFYVSGVINSLRLDLGREVEAENAFMAAIQFHKAVTEYFKRGSDTIVTEVEEIANA